MHPLHDYIAEHLGERVKSKRVVVWYDSRAEFAPFVIELRGGARIDSQPASALVGGLETHLVEYAGSMFELRTAVEHRVSGDSPEPVILYVPGYDGDRRASVLMELEKAGDCYEPQLKRLARNVLRARYTDGVIDELLAPSSVTYEDLARAAVSPDQPSILKGIFVDAHGRESLLAAWLASDARDAEIAEKDVAGELVKLIRSGLGLELSADSELSRLRAATLRYVLAGEFRSDLNCSPPTCLDGVPSPKNKEEEGALRAMALRLRRDFADEYEALADLIEGELGLRHAELPAGGLGAIDTFRFEERSLLTHCGDLIASAKFDEALALVGERENSFWLDRDVERKAQWEACRRMAELGMIAKSVRDGVLKADGDADAWIEAYTGTDGWYRLDQAQRRLEAWVANLEEDPEERALGVVRDAYDVACRTMAQGFAPVFEKSGWTARAQLHQTRVFSEVVSTRPTPVAYFLVDAMRFEMGVELAERLPKSAEVSLRHAVCALPSITPMGMAALQPGAAGSFNVVQRKDRLGGEIDGVFLPDVNARRKFAAARVPELVDLTLDGLLNDSPSKLSKKVSGARVIIIRSQEIDHAGEGGFTRQARQVMDTVIDNLARAIRKLAAVGVEQSVVTADHGHMFFPADRDESMRIDPPGGDTVELHRRCWIGRGGATPSGCVRVSATSFGYASDLDFVFPTGCGVFRAGGDLAFHHGGPSLQELIVPVLSVRSQSTPSGPSKLQSLRVESAPTRITNRIFSVEVSWAEAFPLRVRPLLLREGTQVGSAVAAINAEHEKGEGVVTLASGNPATLVMMLVATAEDKRPVRLVIVDPATDAELYRSPSDIPVSLGV